MTEHEDPRGPRRGLFWLVLALVVAVVAAAVVFFVNSPADEGGSPARPPSAEPDKQPTYTWASLKAFDFSRNDGTWKDTGVVAGRDASLSRMQQAQFGSGPAGTWLTVTAERASDTSTVYGLDLLGEGNRFPNYFALELDYQLPQLSDGMWPAPLWLRPVTTRRDPDPQGEIDIMEWFGAQMGGPHEAAATIHRTPYGEEHRQLSVDTPQLAGDARSLDHHIRFEKVPGRMTWWIDDKPAVTMTRAAFDAKARVRGAWNAMFENPDRQWYPRITYQVGPGADGQLAGDIPAGWRRSDMIIKGLQVFRIAPAAASAAPSAAGETTP